jgi:predicted phosphodiesterase
MKIVVLSDTHGRSTWKKIVDKNKGAHFVFLGDYIDPYSDYEGIDQIDALENLYEIINFKKRNLNSVTLIIGNHDAQYLFYPKFRCNKLISSDLLEDALDAFKSNKKLFQFALQKDNYLFVHAGVTNRWLIENREELDSFGLNKNMKNIAIVLNKMGVNNYALETLMAISRLRGGWNLNGGPLWADNKELFDGYLSGYHQIVGHNKIDNVFTIGDSESSITFCDTLWHNDDYYTLNV